MQTPWRSKKAVPIMIVLLLIIISLSIFIGVMILYDFKFPSKYTQSVLELPISQLDTSAQTQETKKVEDWTAIVPENTMEMETEAETMIFETEAEREPQTESESETETDAERTDNDFLVVIDAGHQGPGQDMSLTEANGPGSSNMKAKFADGTKGVATGLNEYELTLDISMLLQTELEARGYRVIMTRTTHDESIGNIDRAQIANNANADAFVRIHANGHDDSSINGALTMSPSASNPYVSQLYEQCKSLSTCIINSYARATGLKNNGVLLTDDMTGINWSKVPVTILEMGFMTNTDDDLYMADWANRTNMVKGIADGIDDYFNQ